MTFSAALLGTTVRVLRTAAGRRAVQLTLLVGGLFALGFLFGEQAHAADGTPAGGAATSLTSTTSAASATSVTSVLPLTPSDSGAAAQSHPARTTGEKTVTSAQDMQDVQGVLSPVTGTVATVNRTVSTVTGTVSTVVRTVGGATERVVPATLPLPDLGHAPDVPDAVGVQVSAPSRQGQGEGTASRPASPVGTPAPAHPHPRHARTDAGAAAPAGSAPFASYGPESAPGSPCAALPARSSVHHGAAGSNGSVAAPGRPAPAGTPNGVLGKQAAEGTASRHADVYVVTLDHRAPLWLVPCCAVRTDMSRTRERHRDIPVFPG
ncbi:hypothetical protein ABZX95_26500 [Streptomyces sp. NPDC004232]|uniref:hypothetical protein n=1 Tax=Streptomyces sp. NPDC004232 TaxID=3154454 RepID=UPI001E1ADBC1|nr:hypothetical protein [Streptomyces sp. tea 10]